MRISVIIPCKNEVGVVDSLLTCLAKQTRPADQIVVIDSHSSDGTASHVKKIDKELPIIVQRARKKGVSEARNLGAQHATGDILFFFDADVQLAADFLERAMQNITQRTLQAGGFTQRMNSKKAGLRFGARVMNGYSRTMQHTPWPIAFSCLFATREVFNKLHGFDPKIFIMEDYDFMLRAHRNAFKVGIVDVPFFASDRRYIDTSPGLLFRGIYAELYRYTHGMRITKPIFEYEMGGKSSRTSESSKNTQKK